MLIRMKKNQPGSEDGVHIKKYEAGKEYDMAESLAKAFISMGVAEIVESKKAAPAPANKAVAPEKAKSDEEAAKEILAEQGFNKKSDKK